MEVEGVTVDWPKANGAGTAKTVWDERWKIVEPLYQEGKYDNEIAAELGVSAYVILKTRRHAGKPANKRADRYLWHDQTAQQQHAAEMVQHRKNVGRGRKAH